MQQPYKPLIFVTNDDGIHAKGIQALIEALRPLGEVVVVAPDKCNSGMAHAVTLKAPIYLNSIVSNNGYTSYACTGTPADCVKIGIQHVLKRLPDIVVSGINHGSNSSINILYSGTMAAAIEGCMIGVTSVGFSLQDYGKDPDFTTSKVYVEKIVKALLAKPLPRGTCLNVNIPQGTIEQVKEIRICRQTKGSWRETFLERQHPHGFNYYWLTGEYDNHEPEATDTDEWALTNNFVSVVPIQIDMTDYQTIDDLINLQLV